MSRRKHILETIRNVKSLRDRHLYLQKDLVEIDGEENFSKMLIFYSNILEKLTREKYALPIGVRYTGTFYIKKPYSVPTEYVKIEGSAFLREDLVRWVIEGVEQYKGSYFRAIYQHPHDKPGSEIAREDGKLVYETPADEQV